MTTPKREMIAEEFAAIEDDGCIEIGGTFGYFNEYPKAIFIPKKAVVMVESIGIKTRHTMPNTPAMWALVTSEIEEADLAARLNSYSY